VLNLTSPADEACRADLSDLFAIFDSLCNPVTVHSAADRLIHANRAAIAVLGSEQLSSLRLPSVAGDEIELDGASEVRRRFRLESRPLHSDPTVVVRVWHELTGAGSLTERDRGLAAIVQTSDDAIVSKLLDGTITSWNPAAERLFGWTASEMIGQSIKKIVPPEKRSDLASILGRLGQGERIDHHETVRITKDGRRIDVSVSVSPVKDDTGQIIGAAKICRDVTDRKRSENRQRLLAALGDTALDATCIEHSLENVAKLCLGSLADRVTVYVARADGRFARTSAFSCPTSESSPDHELDEVAVVESVSTEGVARSNRLSTHGGADLEGSAPYSRIVLPLAARGVDFGALVLYSAPPRREYDALDLELANELGRRVTLALDNSRLLDETRSAEERFRALFNAGSVGVVVIDRDGRYLEANDVALSMLASTIDELRERRVGNDSLGARDSDFWPQLRTLGEWHGELELTTRQGESVPIEVHAMSVDLPDGRVHLVQWIDVSARKAAEHFEDLFLSDLAHDLNNPLASMRVQAQLMQRRLTRGTLNERMMSDGLSAIEASTGRMSRRIGELADIARLRLGGVLELRHDAFDLVALMRELTAAHQQTTELHLVDMRSDVAYIEVDWDRSRLERVLDNLLANAIKYSPAGGPVLVSLSLESAPNGNHVKLSISDRGVGIPASDLPFIFDRFRRGSNVTGRFAGAGIGLAEAKQIVTQHGGTIDLRSEEGTGTTVTVRLPIACSKAAVHGDISLSA
jgi:PAS domain S-box-containing protein